MLKKLILASTSPYRAALLERLSLSFEKVGSDVDEDSFKEAISDPRELTETLAYEKAKSVLEIHPDAIVLGGDQISLFKDEILGKPHTVENAVNQLLKLQGKSHQLITSTCLLSKDEKILWTEVTTLTMRSLNEAECLSYVQKDSPLNCAGSYMIEKLGISLFEKIEGADQTAIIGLPLIRVTTELRKRGFDIP